MSKRSIFPLVLVELRPSAISAGGIGVFAVDNIRHETYIFDGVHIEDFSEITPWSVYESLDTATKKKVIDFCVGTPDGFIAPENNNFNELSIEWYLNHSCDGNVAFDINGDFVAARDIHAGEELSYDYGLVESNPKFRMECTCGYIACRKVITGEDWKILRQDPKIAVQMHPFLRERIL